ncbi:MAG: motility associated factor glycosyltransferase family protein [Deltaproteobacteria bacterium]|nr:motility associated factor glycosyltransferase family protein [Deltaproteobacteria bacterium]
MNNTLRGNIEILAERYPELAKKLEETKDNGQYALTHAPTRFPNVMISNGSELISFYNTDDPIQSVKNYLQGMTVKYARFVVFLGLGLGYHLNAFFKELSSKWDTHEIIVFEKDLDLFRLALTVGDYREIIKHPHIHFFVGGEPEDSFTKLRKYIFTTDSYALRSIKILPLPTSIKLHGEYYSRAVKTIKKAANQIMVAAGNDSFDSFVGLENIIENLPHILSNPGINSLFGRFTGKPGVLVAAGPSLNKNMHLLKKIHDKALILSCDASFLPLMKRGIRPHMVTSMERTPGTEVFYTGIEDFRDIYFIGVAVLMKDVMEVFKGKKFIAYRSYSHFDWLGIEKGQLYSGLSVANMAFKILSSLGCDPIILIGQDLAYATDGDTHVKGNVFGHRDENIRSKPMIELEGSDGQPVKSEKIWEIIKLFYEADLESYTGTCINATEGGAKIRGARVMPFSEAIDQYCRETFNPGEILAEVHHRFMNELRPYDDWIKLQIKTEKTRIKINEIIDKFCDAARIGQEVEADIIKQFIDGKIKSGLDMERLFSVEKLWVELFKTICDDKDLYNIIYQTIQPYDTWFSNELSFLKDIYTTKEILSMARVKNMTQWFAVVGSFFIFTRIALSKAEKIIKEELGKLERPNCDLSYSPKTGEVGAGINDQ